MCLYAICKDEHQDIYNNNAALSIKPHTSYVKAGLQSEPRKNEMNYFAAESSPKLITPWWTCQSKHGTQLPNWKRNCNLRRSYLNPACHHNHAIISGNHKLHHMLHRAKTEAILTSAICAAVFSVSAKNLQGLFEGKNLQRRSNKRRSCTSMFSVRDCRNDWLYINKWFLIENLSEWIKPLFSCLMFSFVNFHYNDFMMKI